MMMLNHTTVKCHCFMQELGLLAEGLAATDKDGYVHGMLHTFNEATEFSNQGNNTKWKYVILCLDHLMHDSARFEEASCPLVLNRLVLLETLIECMEAAHTVLHSQISLNARIRQAVAELVYFDANVISFRDFEGRIGTWSCLLQQRAHSSAR